MAEMQNKKGGEHGRAATFKFMVRYLYRLAGVAAVVGEDGGDGLQDFAGVAPGHHQAEEAGAGQSGDGLSCRVVGPRAPDCRLQQQLE